MQAYSRGSVFAETTNSLKSLTGYVKTHQIRCLKGFWIRLCWRQVGGVQKELSTPLREMQYAFWNISMILGNVWHVMQRLPPLENDDLFLLILINTHVNITKSQWDFSH